MLPVFFNLRGKPVLVIGGGEPAAWKAELLAQAGASVRVVAGGFCDELLELAGRTELQGKVELHAGHYDEADFKGMALVVADAEDEAEAALISQTAARFGVPCNTIDRAEFCTFQFGSIVNRSPVVIGISTDGAAPVLGQSIRTRIESLLPQTLSRWANYAREIRPLVLKRVLPGDGRRRFWAQFADVSFGPFLPDRVWSSSSLIEGASKKGSVSRIKVASDDPEELSLRSIRILLNADIILCHADIHPAILEHARREAKRSFFESSGQMETSAIRHASSGLNVAVVEPSHLQFTGDDHPVGKVTGSFNSMSAP